MVLHVFILLVLLYLLELVIHMEFEFHLLIERQVAGREDQFVMEIAVVIVLVKSLFHLFLFNQICFVSFDLTH